ncbi:hypothetical protein [Alkalimarinus coralli]|uniref:hypothetical protein n=1 Tax=Alkalimarinus coralli TaxID=2935863 RepID=UPI00202B99C9|nr:hypothetical protein [Alkalimarinus coralli]
MIYLIHLLEITLFLLVILLWCRVLKTYNAETKAVTIEELSSDSKQLLHDTANPVKVADGKSLVEAYIGDFFPSEPDDSLSILRTASQQGTGSTEHSANAKAVDCDRSISSKVIDAMMAEADMVCAS